MDIRKDVRGRRSSRCQGFLVGLMTALISMPSSAIEIPEVPPSSGNGVPPNILFVLDDSGSMSWSAMPNNTRHGNLRNNIWDRSYVHNTLYYNPAVDYQPWLGADGERLSGGTSYDRAYADMHLASEPIDLSDDDSCQWVDENSSNDSYKVCGGTQYFYVPKDTSRTDSGYLSNPRNFYRFRIDDDGDIRRHHMNGGGQWRNGTRVTPTGRSEAEERRNFATWFSYHRTRMKAAKAGASEAFGMLDGSQYRLGFKTIRGPHGNPGNDQLDIPVWNDNGLFRGDNREEWFEHLFTARGELGTPLRSAVKSAGEYYKRSDSNGPYGGHLDHNNQQFQCRQNFSIVTTDGFWNGSSPNVGNADNTSGPTINGPIGDDGEPTGTFRYSPEEPYEGSPSNTLADVAMHYWKNDLRAGLDNVVPVSPANPAFWQHMVTFGISIGLGGTVDQTSVREVVEYGGVSKGGSRLSGWPDPTDREDERRIDDLLHAAVNGRGEFIAASNPEAFREGLRAALAAINDRTASASNVATSSTSLSTDSLLFQAVYTGGQWSGELRAIPLVDRTPVNASPVWRASEQMPTSAASRKVFTFDDGAGEEFRYAALSPATRDGFGGPDVGNIDSDEVAERRINYLRGHAADEQSNGGPFRNRYRAVTGRVPLGDIIHSSPVHMENSGAGADALFVGANDGMLHAFNPATGAELFSYVPAGLDKDALVELTRPDYGHGYFVDGPVVVSDAAIGDGKHILAGTLGRGGKGLYALDVTSPGTFGKSDVLWDRTTQSNSDEHLGYVLGRPIIVKLNNGDPGVIFGNGPNSASGHAVLFVANLETGDVLARIDTGVGGDNALGPPTGWDSDGDGDVDFVYAGDMHGHVWKFDLTHSNNTQWDVALGGEPLFTATDSAGKAQPITGAVAVALDPTTYRRWVLAGTGRLYNNDDLWNDDGTVNTSVQSIYGVHDQEGTGGLGRRADIAGESDGLAVRQITVAGSIDGNPVRGFEPSDRGLTAHQKGWVVDLLSPPSPGTAEGERVVGDIQVLAGVMVFSTTIPGTDPCLPGGRGYLNALNAFTGASVPEHFFDVDRDGEFTDDEVGGEDDGGPGGGTDASVPVGSVDLGLGGNTDPGWMTPLVCVNGMGGGTGCLPYSSSAISGRVSWREILRN